MFEKLYHNYHTLARHKNAPFAEERERFLMHRAEIGYAHSTLLVTASKLLTVSRWIDISNENKISSEQIKAAADRCADQKCQSGLASSPTYVRKSFLRVAMQWLGFLGHLYKPIEKSVPFAGLINDFIIWMKHERGLSPSTIQFKVKYCKQFLSWYETKKSPFVAVKVSNIDSFFAYCRTKVWSRATLSGCASSLRVFFRYAGTRGRCSATIAEAIQSPCCFSQISLPMGISWEDVKRLLASTETNRPRDIRDRAIMMLFAIYGLRRSEVANLQLEDIDWEHDKISVRRTKARKVQTYPLIPLVGNAILRYLQEVRPRSSRRDVFLILRAPFGNIYQSLGYVIEDHLNALGIQAAHHGPHILRHACATHLLSQDFSIKEIGDHLGHRSSAATEIYAKVNLAGLRKVATFDLGGVL